MKKHKYKKELKKSLIKMQEWISYGDLMRLFENSFIQDDEACVFTETVFGKAIILPANDFIDEWLSEYSSGDRIFELNSDYKGRVDIFASKKSEDEYKYKYLVSKEIDLSSSSQMAFKIDRTECYYNEINMIHKLLMEFRQGNKTNEWKMEDIEDKDIRAVKWEKNIFKDEFFEKEFHKALKAFEFDDQGKMEVQVKLNNSTDSEDDVHASVTNASMRAMKKAYFNESDKVFKRNLSLDYFYKPFSYTLTISNEDMTKFSADKEYFDVVLRKNYESEGCSLLALLGSDEQHGVTIESVTPLAQKQVDENNKEITEMKDYLLKNKPVDVDFEELNRTLKPLDLAKEMRFTIFPVGNANFITCETEDFAFSFDSGRPIDAILTNKFAEKYDDCKKKNPDDHINFEQYKNNKDEKEAYRNYVDICTDKLLDDNKLNCNVHFITHWHSDHYSVLYAKLRDVYNTNRKRKIRVFAPDYSDWLANSSFSEVIDLLYFMVMHGMLKIYDQYGECIYSSANGKSKIYLGKANGTINPTTNKRENVENCKSLIYESEDVLLTGDCFYSSWPDSLKSNNNLICENKYKYIVAPHHGSKDSLDAEKIVKLIKNNGTLFFCTGPNYYHHPDYFLMKQIDDEILKQNKKVRRVFTNVGFVNDTFVDISPDENLFPISFIERF